MCKEIDEVIVHTGRVGIDLAVTTNGVFVDDNIISRCLGSLTWIRISLNAGTPKSYADIHRCNPNDFDKVLKNIENVVEAKKKNSYSCTIGIQMLLLPGNIEEVHLLASTLKDIGVDYLIIKPFSKHPMSRSTIDKGFDYDDYLYLGDELQKFSSHDFKIIFSSGFKKALIFTIDAMGEWNICF